MSRSRHPNKEIEAVLKDAENLGWSVVKAKGSSHAWGLLRCPTHSGCRGGIYCSVSIWSTPKNPTLHARQLMQIVKKCTGEPS